MHIYFSFIGKVSRQVPVFNIKAKIVGKFVQIYGTFLSIRVLTHDHIYRSPLGGVCSVWYFNNPTRRFGKQSRNGERKRNPVASESELMNP